MKRRMVAFLFLLISLGFFAPNLKSQEGTALKQPVAPVRTVTDDYYGTKVVDPYRYMENLKDPEVQAWMKAQNDYTRAQLARIPGREKLLERIRKLDQAVPRVIAVRLPGDFYLIEKRQPTDNISKLYLRQGLNGEDKLLVNPEKIKLAAAIQNKGANAITGSLPSLDDKYVAVGIAPGGSELTEIHVFETSSGHEAQDVIHGVYWLTVSSPSWLPGNRSFVYGRPRNLPPGAPATEVDQKSRVYLHVLGTDPSKDPAVFGYGVVPAIQVDPRYFPSLAIPLDSAYAIGTIHSGVSGNSSFYIEAAADVGKTNTAWHKVADFTDDVSDVEVHGDDLYMLTYKNASRFRVIRTDARNPDLASAETVVPPSQAVVTGINVARDALYVQLLDGGIGRVLRVPYGPKPQAQEIALPFRGTVSFVETDPRVPGALLGLGSWTKADSIYAYDPETKRVTNTKLQPTGPDDNPTNIESTEVKVRSYDGTLVPLSIVYPKGVKLDGSNPTLLGGYGAYGLVLPPHFEPALFLPWYEQGGIYASCHVRGGGEYGEEWHLAGKGPTKPNTWRDFIACAQYLIEHKYTSPARLAGTGTSAGGILIGRAITSRPDLFAAAIDKVGLSDTLRFETGENGVPNIPEFGSTKTEAGFKALYAMSAYAHIKDHTPYPAVLLMTGVNDPRVDPWQMDKMAARLQAATSSGKPVLLRVSYHGGHGLMGGTEAQFQETRADQLSFLLWQLGDPDFQPSKK
ncbi:MAG: prolyl oligopeptidase family serine peptidase [Candidatus Sulfotelmatobacter sp.]